MDGDDAGGVGKVLVEAGTLPDMRAFHQALSQVVLPDMRALRAVLAEAATLNRFTADVLARQLARQVLMDGTPDEAWRSARWRELANDWLAKNFWGIVFFLASGLLVTVAALTNYGAPELLDDVNRVIATPATLVSIALAVYFYSRRK